MLSAPTTQIYDVLIIGGGPAGLAAACYLVQRHVTVAIFDSRSYRSERVALENNLKLSANHPKYVQKARQNILDSLYRHRVAPRYENVTITSLDLFKESDREYLFKARSNTREDDVWFGRRVILAGGVRDILPNIPGYAESWTQGIIHCMECYTQKEKDVESIGILVLEDVDEVTFTAFNQVLAMFHSKQKPNIYTNGDSQIADQVKAFDKTSRFNVIFDKIQRIQHTSRQQGVLLTLDSNKNIIESLLVHTPRTETMTDFAFDIGIERSDQGDIATNSCQETVVKGVYAAGDCTTTKKIVPFAVQSGTTAAVAVYNSLKNEND